MKRIVAAFDFDGTLTTKDSLLEFIRHAKGSRSLYLGLLRHAPRLVLMVLHLYDNSKAKERFLAHFFKGMEYSEFQKLGESFAPKLETMLRPGTVKVLNSHIRNGAEVYVITASVPEWVRPICLSLGVKQVLGTEMEVGADGRLTGRFANNNCYGGEKVRRLLMVAPDREEYELYAYGDSNGDTEMLALADHGTLVSKGLG